jgi:hypothetical protein
MRRRAQISLLSLKTKVNGLSVGWPQNHWDDFSWFGLKTGGDSFSGLTSKPMANDFSWFGLKTGGDEFPCLGLKTGSYDLMI